MTRSGFLKSWLSCADCWEVGFIRRFFFCGREDLGSIEVGMDSGIGSDMIDCVCLWVWVRW